MHYQLGGFLHTLPYNMLSRMIIHKQNNTPHDTTKHCHHVSYTIYQSLAFRYKSNDHTMNSFFTCFI